MKTILKTVLALSFAALLAACSNNPQTADSHEGHDHATTAPVAAAAAAPTTSASVSVKDDHLNAVYEQYQQLTSALTDGKVAEAKIAALALESGAKEIKGGATLAKTAAQITNAADLESQRTTFASLNDEFIALLKETGLNSGELYVAHCPMALNDKGAYWVSNTKEIKNPYFGESMLTCGAVKETIK
jgi:hypothetical protein